MQKWKKVKRLHVSHDVGQVCGDDGNHSKKPPREQGASRRNMLGRENNCKSFVKISNIAQG